MKSHGRAGEGDLHTISLLLVAWTLVSSLAPPAAAARRRFFNTVNVTSSTFIYSSSFHDYVDSTYAHGIRGLRVSGQWRMKCYQCAPDTLDFDTEPALGVFDFSTYFDRLDYAITTKGMKGLVSFNLGGRLLSDGLSPGSQPVWPPFLGSNDAMMYRKSAGVDQIYDYNKIKTPRFERPSTRQAMLGFVDAVVQQFGARYGDKILGYSFTFAHFGESEYPLASYPYFCDTSPDAAVAFRDWLRWHYATPQAVAAAWGHSPAFTTWDQIQILDGAASTPQGQAPKAYLDFMAYREHALGQFLHDIRDHVHAAGGLAMAQFGSVWDVNSCTRGTFGFGPMVQGFDLVVIDDAPTYDHTWSMDYTRTNSPASFGNEVDAPCDLGCLTGDISQCCYPFPGDGGIWSLQLGIQQMSTQVSQSWDRGATWVDMANWDNFYQAAFGLYAGAIASAFVMSSALVTNVAAADTQHVSLRDLYVHHHNQSWINGLIGTHTAMGGQSTPIAVKLSYDLAPPVPVDVTSGMDPARVKLSVAAPNPSRGRTSTIRFELATRERVTLRVVDAAGRVRATLAAREFGQGPHALAFDAHGLPRGVYLLRLETPTASAATKLEVLR